MSFPRYQEIETILVVEDNELILQTVVSILVTTNFRVLSANNGADGIKLAEKTEGNIDLLLSGVDMPLMSGPYLAEIIKEARPAISVMLMSGEANGNLLILNYGWACIRKPFLPVKLVQIIKDVLRSKNRSQLDGHEFDRLS
jgi:two-component system cell cycle sensor histidine kinase/response regulator CckA